MFMIVSPDDTQVYELNTGMLKVKNNFHDKFTF